MTIRDGVCWMFDFYKFFYPIYQTTVVGILPVILMSAFGFLTVRGPYQRHAANIRVGQKDPDLMRTLVAEIMVNIFTLIIFSCNLLYGTATYFVINKSASHLEVKGFVNFLSQFLMNLLSIAPFYLYIIASKSFRRKFCRIMLNWWYKYKLRRTGVTPLRHRPTVLTMQHRRTTDKSF